MLAALATDRSLTSLLVSPSALRSKVVKACYEPSATSRPSAAISARQRRRADINRHCSGALSLTAASSAKLSSPTYIRGLRFQTTASPAPLSPIQSPDVRPEAPQQASRLRRFAFASALFFISFVAGGAMAAAPVAEAVNGFLNPPTDEETLSIFEPSTPAATEINARIVNHPLAQKLRAQEGMTESRPHLKIPPAMRPHNLTGGTLLGENKIEVPPLTFSEKNGELPTLVQISYLGSALCGHPGIVHGGLLATMLDEGLARACFPALPNKVGVTASLKIDYRVPCPGNSYVVLKAQTTKVEGRKAWVTGWIELLGDDDGEGTKLVEAEALFIEPKQAKQMARVYSTQ